MPKVQMLDLILFVQLKLRISIYVSYVIQYENRKCKICKVLEDKFHFLFECPIYMELRNMYISKYFWQRPNMIKFVELLTTEHRKTLVKLGIFVEKAFQIRKQIMPL